MTCNLHTGFNSAGVGASIYNETPVPQSRICSKKILMADLSLFSTTDTIIKTCSIQVKPYIRNDI
jgi:hypothetical protein